MPTKTCAIPYVTYWPLPFSQKLQKDVMLLKTLFEDVLLLKTLFEDVLRFSRRFALFEDVSVFKDTVIFRVITRVILST